MKKVLMITYVFPPIAYAGTYRTLRFCRYLPEYDWLPEVITIKRGDDLDNDDTLLDKIPEVVEVHRTNTIDFWRWWRKRSSAENKSIKEDNPSVAKKTESNGQTLKKTSWSGKIKTAIWELLTTPDHMVFWVPFALLKGISILRHKAIEVIYTSSPPHSEHLVGLGLRRLFNKPWVADFRDPILDSSGYNTASSYRRRVDQLLEKLIVKRADKVLIISNHYKEIMAKRYPEQAHKFISMPNAYDPDDFDGVKKHHFNKFTIIYSGTFYANRSPRFFLEGLASWYQKQPREIQENIQVIFYGIMPAEVSGYIERHGLKNVVRTPGMISKEKLIPELKGAALLLLIIGFDTESRGTLTSKIFEYMACKRPILAIMPEGDAADILREYNQTFWVNSENKDLLGQYLDEAYRRYTEENNNAGETLSEQINFLTTYDARNLSGKLAAVFDECAQKRPSRTTF